MKNIFELEVIDSIRALTINEQIDLRAELKSLLKFDGVISLCLEAQNLYIEFNPRRFNLESFKSILKDIGFPLKHELKIASFHFAV